MYTLEWNTGLPTLTSWCDIRIISEAWCRGVMTPLLMHWSCVPTALCLLSKISNFPLWPYDMMLVLCWRPDVKGPGFTASALNLRPCCAGLPIWYSGSWCPHLPYLWVCVYVCTTPTNMCICIYICVCIYICMYSYTHVCLDTSIHWSMGG